MLLMDMVENDHIIAWRNKRNYLSIVFKWNTTKVIPGVAGGFRNNVSLHQKIDVLVQERRNSIANALALRFSCTSPSRFLSFSYRICMIMGNIRLNSECCIWRLHCWILGMHNNFNPHFITVVTTYPCWVPALGWSVSPWASFLYTTLANACYSLSTQSRGLCRIRWLTWWMTVKLGGGARIRKMIPRNTNWYLEFKW